MASDKAKITDVAARAGVSIKTVSRVMNREPNVRADTRERVLEATAALGYEPNPAARGLASRRSFSLGLLYENPHEFSYTQRAFDGVFASCTAAGYTLLMLPCGSEDDASSAADSALHLAIQARVDGVILTAPLCDDGKLLDALRERDTPSARIATATPEGSSCTVRAGDRDAACAITEHLLDLGHQRIAFVKGDPRHGASNERFAGFRQGLKARGVPLDSALVAEGHFDFDSGRQAAFGLLNLPHRPTAIFASNDDMAAGAIAAAHALGLAVPTAVSVAGFDDSPIASRTWPPLTTARQPVFEMAAAVTDDLIAQLRGQLDTPRHRLFDCPLVLRESTAPPAAVAKKEPSKGEHERAERRVKS